MMTQTNKGQALGEINIGAGSARIEAGGALASASLAGVVTQANSYTLSAALLDHVVRRGAAGVLCDTTGAALCLPPIEPEHYSYVPEDLRLVPVAVVVSPAQMAIYAAISQAGARAGVIRRAFLSRGHALAWLEEEAQVWAEVRASLRVHRAPAGAPGTRSGTAASRAGRGGPAVRPPSALAR